MLTELPPQRDLVLVGGGHAHALVLRRIAMQAPGDLRITLISPDAYTPYSGMLPGLLAGHYRFEDAHIDLARLCQWAGVRFYADTVRNLDPQRQCLHCRERGEVHYDVLSLDIGSQPELDSVPGAREHATPVKPVAGLWARWQTLANEVDRAGQRIAVVGGGAGSVEISLAIAHRLREGKPQIDLYCGATLLEEYADRTRRLVREALDDYGVAVHSGHRVERVDASTLYFADAPDAAFETLIWSTGAAAAPWVGESGLPVDERGFMLVEDSLQSTIYPNVFGAGDIATQRRHPRPKAGVYAVRQGPVLADNLLAYLQGRELRQHRPQSRFLSMLALGRRRAVAERNGISLSGRWTWHWKDRIDRAFMRRFSELPQRSMAAPAITATAAQQPCGGCGAKVGATTLRRVLDELRDAYPGQIARSDELDDAAIIDVGAPLLQSVDSLRALVDDPWMMGRIAAQHALSDLYACGATPHSALAQVCLPFAADTLLHRDLHAVLRGALSVFSECGCRLLGGHSMQGAEFQIGFTVNGELHGLAPLPKQGGRAGDSLLLSKPLGSGALFAAYMQSRADGRHIAQALAVMQQSNALAAQVAREHGASAVTDVTGFGLAGHLSEMLGTDLAARLELQKLPCLSGALDAMRCGIFSTLHAVNRRSREEDCLIEARDGIAAELLFDPQTSGGLLMALPAGAVAAALQRLREGGCQAAAIGALEQVVETQPRIRLT